ncbi:MAG: SIMPL domain-containing protein [Patescibacteria group bacterium]
MEKSKKYLYNVAVIFVVFLTIFVIALTINEFAENKYTGLDDSRSIRVSGEETLYEAPDEAEIIFSVVTQGSDYEQATNRNSERMNEITEYLRDEGVSDSNLRTMNFSVSPRYENIEEENRTRREIIGYEVENNLRVKTEELEKIDSLISGAVDAGANKVSNLSFLVSNEEEIKKEARDKAIENAREEAEAIADSLGVDLGRILDYSESGYYPVGRSVEMMESDAADQNVPIEAGENEIRSSVDVTFEIN